MMQSTIQIQFFSFMVIYFYLKLERKLESGYEICTKEWE
jgi:hypothetical protein